MRTETKSREMREKIHKQMSVLDSKNTNEIDIDKYTSARDWLDTLDLAFNWVLENSKELNSEKFQKGKICYDD